MFVRAASNDAVAAFCAGSGVFPARPVAVIVAFPAGALAVASLPCAEFPALAAAAASSIWATKPAVCASLFFPAISSNRSATSTTSPG